MLGATGSIGAQALDVAARLGLPVVGLAAGRWTEAFAEIAGRHPDATLAIADDTTTISPGAHLGRLGRGPAAVAALAAIPRSTVINGIVGAAGLAPSLAALHAGNRLGLANKETMVAGGDLVTAAATTGGGTLIPIDSEHSALWQCLVGEASQGVARLVLTASGGPFRGRTTTELEGVTPDQALAHPTWDMGRRISIDSATLMNKALEVIEAHHLFGISYDQIEVVVHPQSVVHSMVEFVDGSIKAQLGDPDMRGPIQYAITAPDRIEGHGPAPGLAGYTLTFEEPDRETFPCLDLGYHAGRRGGIVPAVLNAADEVAVAAFLDGRIRFLAIAEIVTAVVGGTPDLVAGTVDDVLDADRDARERTEALVAAAGS